VYSARRLDVGAGLWYNGDSRVAKGEVVYADTASGQPGTTVSRRWSSPRSTQDRGGHGGVDAEGPDRGLSHRPTPNGRQL
jgi:hypothetical protein